MGRRVSPGDVSSGNAPRPSSRPYGTPKLIPIEATLFASSDRTLQVALARGTLSDAAAWERLSSLAEAGEAERLMSCRLMCPDGKLVEHAESASESSEVVRGRLEFHPARLVDPEYETLTLGHHLSLPTSGVRLVAVAPTPNHFSFDESPPMQRLTFIRSVFHGSDQTPGGPQEPDEELQWAAVSLPRELGTALSEVRNDPDRAARLVWEAVTAERGRLTLFTAHAGKNSSLQSRVTSTWPFWNTVKRRDPHHASQYLTGTIGLFSENAQPRSHTPFGEEEPSAEKGPPSLDIEFPVAADRHPVVKDLFAIVKEDEDPFYPESFEFDPDSIPLPENVGKWSLGTIQSTKAPAGAPEHERWMAIVIRRVPGA